MGQKRYSRVRCSGVCLIVAIGILLEVPCAQANFMYWTDQNTGEIRRANLDGTGQQTVVLGQGVGLTGIALDVTAGQIYWTNQGGSFIRRANLDGTAQQTLVSGSIAPYGIALDRAAGQMYWTNTGGSNNIRRANLDGTGQQTLVTGTVSPVGIALDLAGGKMYWAEQFGQSIWTANLDGTEQDRLLSGLTEPVGIALDVAANKIYWTDFQSAAFGGGIRRANLDGTGMEILVDEGALGIALDLKAGKMYWTNHMEIRRANLDGTGQQTLVTGTVFDDFVGIALQVGIVPIPELVSIDIHSGSFPNSINPRSKGVILVAILTTDTFDATTVDPLSVQFGPDGAPEAHGRGHTEDVNGDGKKDLVLHFRTQDTGIVCGDTSASLTGEIYSGQAIEGTDSIRTVGCK